MLVSGPSYKRTLDDRTATGFAVHFVAEQVNHTIVNAYGRLFEDSET